MNRWNLRSGILVSIIGLAAAVPSAHAQQPPDVVQSDAIGNTASGTGALAAAISSAGRNSAFGYGALNLNSTGAFNTAAGYATLGANTSGSGNSAFGYGALQENSTGQANTAVGFTALSGNTTGFYNVAIGSYSLYTSRTSSYNTAIGYQAQFLDTTGISNVAVGANSLYYNSIGNNNTAVGDGSLYSNIGDNNTASGFDALQSNTTGANNTAFGYAALYSNTTGKGNEAQGVNALFGNTTGIRNLGIGSNALYGNTTGSYNVALGFDAGHNQTTGSYNVALGLDAGYNQTTGSYNIYIANPGIAGESQTLRLGVQPDLPGSGILSAYIAGVAFSQVTGSAVYVTQSGQLGVLASSERFKTDVEPMGAASEKLAQLRPVTFKLKTDSQGTKQYGLIAEEVAKVYPELVIHGADGRIDGLRYEELAPMLLNVVQQQQAQLAAQAKKADSQAEVIHNLEMQVAQLNEFRQSMITALRDAPPRKQLIARAP